MESNTSANSFNGRENEGVRRIKIGSKASICIGDITSIFLITNTKDINPQKGSISPESPIGAALLGKKEGESFSYTANDGKFIGTVLKIYD